MPWLPLAILLIVALTAAALALILFPPGEGRTADAEGDITDGDSDAMLEDESGADLADEASHDDLDPSSADDDPLLPGEHEGSPAESEPAPEPDRRNGGPSHS